MGLFSCKNEPKEEKSREVTTEMQRVAAMARICLETKEFKEYRDRYVALEREIVEELIKDARMFNVDRSDISKFGAKCLVRLTRLYDLRSILISVSNDAAKDNKAQSDG